MRYRENNQHQAIGKLAVFERFKLKVIAGLVIFLLVNIANVSAADRLIKLDFDDAFDEITEGANVVGGIRIGGRQWREDASGNPLAGRGKLLFPSIMGDVELNFIADFLGGNQEHLFDCSVSECTKQFSLRSILNIVIVTDNPATGNKAKVKDFFPFSQYWKIKKEIGVTADDLYNTANLYQSEEEAHASLPDAGTAWGDRLKYLITYLRPSDGVAFYYCDIRCPGGGPAGWYNQLGQSISGAAKFGVPLAPKAQDTLRLNVLHTGAGNCIVLECPGNESRALLVDCGSRGNGRYDEGNDEGAKYRGEFRTAAGGLFSAPATVPAAGKAYNILRNYNNIALFITHPDSDHLNQVNTILTGANEFAGLINRVQKVYLGGNDTQYGHTSDASQLLGTLTSMAGAENKIHFMSSRDVTQPYRRIKRRVDGTVEEFQTQPIALGEIPGVCGADTTVTLVAANSSSRPFANWDNPNTTNQQSLVLQIEYQNKVIVLPGDVTKEGLDKSRLSGGIRRNVDIVVAPHHGSAELQSNDADWISHINARHVVFSHGLQFGHPKKSTVDIYNAQNRMVPAEVHKLRTENNGLLFFQENDYNKAIYSTWLHGDIIFNIDNGGAMTANCYGPYNSEYFSVEAASPFSMWCSPLK